MKFGKGVDYTILHGYTAVTLDGKGETRGKNVNWATALRCMKFGMDPCYDPLVSAYFLIIIVISGSVAIVQKQSDLLLASCYLGVYYGLSDIFNYIFMVTRGLEVQ